MIALGGYLVAACVRPCARLDRSWSLGLSRRLCFTLRGGGEARDDAEIAARASSAARRSASSRSPRCARATDRDHDGASALFGGGDCDDRDARINPRGRSTSPATASTKTARAADAVPRVRAKGRPGRAEGSARDLLPKGLNVILITVDTLRGDLGYAGNPEPLSPNLDALAARSTVFDRAYSLASYTGKSVGPLLIGKYPSETHRGWGHFNRYGGEDTLVAERLQTAGIHTVRRPRALVLQRPVRPHPRVRPVGQQRAAAPAARIKTTIATVTGGELTDAAIRSPLQTRPLRRRRFFGWIHYLDPHCRIRHASRGPRLWAPACAACTTARSGTPTSRSGASRLRRPAAVGQQDRDHRDRAITARPSASTA